MKRLPIAPIAGFMASFTIPDESNNTAVSLALNGYYVDALRWVARRYTGIDTFSSTLSFRGDELLKGWLPPLIGGLAHRYLGKYVNRYIPKSIPIAL